MTMACLELTEDSRETFEVSLQNIRELSQTLKLSIPVCVQLKGAQISTGSLLFGQQEVHLRAGDSITLRTNRIFQDEGTQHQLFVDYQDIAKKVQIGEKIYLDDYRLVLECESKEGHDVVCRVEVGGKLGSNRTVNLPNVALDLPILSPQDRADLAFCVPQGVDFVIVPRIRRASDVLEVRNELGEVSKIISRITNFEGLENLEEIIEASDGIAFSAHDLAHEISPDELLLQQRLVTERCRASGKPSICFLNSSFEDRGLSLVRGADCVLLDLESSNEETLKETSEFCKVAEASFWRYFGDTLPNADALIERIVEKRPTAVIVSTRAGDSLRVLGRHRLKSPIFVVSRDPLIRQLGLHFGVFPLLYQGNFSSINPQGSKDWVQDVEGQTSFVTSFLFERGFLKPGDPIAVIHEWASNKETQFAFRLAFVREDGKHS